MMTTSGSTSKLATIDPYKDLPPIKVNPASPYPTCIVLNDFLKQIEPAFQTEFFRSIHADIHSVVESITIL
jgi:hypothetical protein